MIFISHTWKYDEENRNTHRRAMYLTNELRKIGKKVWFDEDNMRYGNIDSLMADGIEKCSYFVVLLTKQYINKVNNGCRKIPISDNCAKEFNYALISKKPIIPIIFEPAIQDISKWSSGVLTLFLGNNMNIRATEDDWYNYAIKINDMIKNIPPGSPTKKMTESSRYKKTNSFNNNTYTHSDYQETPRQNLLRCCSNTLLYKKKFNILSIKNIRMLNL